MASTIGPATTRDGVLLRTRHWAPSGKPWAATLIVHGLSEHSGRYEHVGGWLAAAGIDAYAYDQRGWGGSDGRRGDVVRWDDLVADLAERLDDVRASSAGLPVAVYAHSMGGLVATSHVLSGAVPPDYLVLSAPGIDSTHGRRVRLAAATFGRALPTSRPPVPRHGGSTLSRDPLVGAALWVDPLAVHAPTARFGARAFVAQRSARDRIDRLAAAGGSWPVPTLVIHGSDDGIVPVAATERFEQFAGVTRRVYPGLRHELHNEPEGHAVVADVIGWLRAQVAVGRDGRPYGEGAAGAGVSARPAAE